MDISSLNAEYYANQAKNAKSSKLSGNLKNADLSGATDEELMDVCKQFESYFVEQVLKQAMDTFTEGDVTESGSLSTLTNYFKDGLMTEYAEKITDQQDLGLAKTLYEQMKRNYSPDDIKKAEVEADDTSAKEAVSTAMNEEN
ncbi:MAG: rod-binding protein [Lachnospiraceae bacterium]|nr:rod-binding protein [Lachnospiraceae bacterium]